MKWHERVLTAEHRQDWEEAIALVQPHAECYSIDHHRHDNHLWHMDLLARAGRFAELAERALADVHARRRLNRALRERGMDSELRSRATDGDRDALYALLRLLCETNRRQEAERVVQALAPGDDHAHQIVDCPTPPSPSNGAR
ncbi:MULTISPECIES: hypothetical protein [unclassified Streptomyces]|uniref:hypothetical protein n=1 Tax=unclassified Streptomyces TaxID=2593676 RepID=UPI0009A10DDB|nr:MULTISPECIES: hypothetical protein [unclassified Streptomyces]